MATKKVETKKGKAKVAEKVAKGKAKVKAKLGKKSAIVALCIALAAICGCATSEPASRATTARYGDIVVKIDDGAYGNTITLTIGDGALASADSSGSTETMTANPTNEVKPDIDVSVPVNKAGAAQSVGSVIGDAVASLITGAKSKTTETTSADTSASSACADGACSEK